MTSTVSRHVFGIDIKLGSSSEYHRRSERTVGRNSNIDGAMITCNYDGTDKHRTVIGNDVFVGSDSQLIAPVRIVVDMTIGE